MTAKEYVLKKLDREVSAAFHAEFSLIGGFPIITLWAAEHHTIDAAGKVIEADTDEELPE